MIVCESREQTLFRQEQDRVCKVSMRASETCEQTLNRQEHNRMHMTSSSHFTPNCKVTLHMHFRVPYVNLAEPRLLVHFIHARTCTRRHALPRPHVTYRAIRTIACATKWRT